MRRLVFLDFDGVIMTYESYERARVEGTTYRDRPTFARDLAVSRMEPACVARVSTLCVRAEADVVLSTAWRGSTEEDRAALEEALWIRGLDPHVPVVGQTPDFRGERSRGEEIAAWLDRHRPGWTRDRIVILDDDDHIQPLNDRWVQSSFTGGGFGDEHLAAALALFGRAP